MGTSNKTNFWGKKSKPTIAKKKLILSGPFQSPENIFKSKNSRCFIIDLLIQNDLLNLQLRFLVLRSIGQARKCSDLELNSMRVYLGFESVRPCLRGSSSNSTPLLSSFFLGMMSLKDRQSLIHLGAERLGGLQHVRQLQVVNLAASQLSSQPGLSASSG